MNRETKYIFKPLSSVTENEPLLGKVVLGFNPETGNCSTCTLIQRGRGYEDKIYYSYSLGYPLSQNQPPLLTHFCEIPNKKNTEIDL